MFDDVVTIELRAIAGVTYPLVDKSYTPDAAAGGSTEGLTRQLERYPDRTVPVPGLAASGSVPLDDAVERPRQLAQARPRIEDYSARKHPEFVVLDIGGDVGALIVHDRSGACTGVEIEISPADDDRRRSHKEVLERDAAGGAAFTAVFDSSARAPTRSGDDDAGARREARGRGGRCAGAEAARDHAAASAPAGGVTRHAWHAERCGRIAGGFDPAERRRLAASAAAVLALHVIGSGS